VRQLIFEVPWTGDAHGMNKDTEEYDVEACPFCNRDRQLVFGGNFRGVGDCRAYIHCQHCGASGPYSDGKSDKEAREGAVLWWNTISLDRARNALRKASREN
jgi:hypothetical protein